MVNKVTIIGNVGKDPEIRAMNNGKEVASFSVGVSDKWTDKNSGERKTQTEWINVSCFNEGLIGVIKNYIKKGSKLYIEGAFRTRKWQDKEGKDRYSTEVVLQGFNGNIIMLDSKGDNKANSSSVAKTETVDDLDDEIPF